MITIGRATGVRIAQAFARARDVFVLEYCDLSQRSPCRDCGGRAIHFTGTKYCPPLCEWCFRALHAHAAEAV